MTLPGLHRNFASRRSLAVHHVLAPIQMSICIARADMRTWYSLHVRLANCASSKVRQAACAPRVRHTAFFALPTGL